MTRSKVTEQTWKSQNPMKILQVEIIVTYMKILVSELNKILDIRNKWSALAKSFAWSETLLVRALSQTPGLQVQSPVTACTRIHQWVRELVQQQIDVSLSVPSSLSKNQQIKFKYISI